MRKKSFSWKIACHEKGIHGPLNFSEEEASAQCESCPFDVLPRLGLIVSRKFQRVRLPSTMSDSGVSLWFPVVIVSKVFQRAKSLPRCATQGCPWRLARRTRDWIVDLTQVTATLPQLPARGDIQSQSRWGYKIYYQCLAFINNLEDWSAREFC